MRRIERLINLVAALLETSRPMTADDIRHNIAGYDEPPNFEAFRRTFERDKESLRAIGIPLDVVTTDAWDDTLDGYIIPKARYYLPDIDFEPDEVAALRIAAEALLGGGEQAEAGLMKLSLDTSSAPWSGPRAVFGADLSVEAAVLGPLYSAVIERSPLSFDYRSARSDDARSREVEGYGLLHRFGHWYLVGRDRSDGVVKSFKVARISSSPRRGDGTYEVPPDFDAGQHLAGKSFEIGDDVQSAIVRFDASMRWWPEQNLPQAEKKEGPEGALDVEVPVANVDALVSWLLGFGPGVELVAPAEARARLREHLAPYLDKAAQ
jgi:proteasome accessory factor B